MACGPENRNLDEARQVSPEQHHYEGKPDHPSAGSSEAGNQGLTRDHDVARRGVENHKAHGQGDHQQPQQAVAVGCPGDRAGDEITRSNGSENENEARADCNGAAVEPALRRIWRSYLGGQNGLRGWLGMVTRALETQFQTELDLTTFSRARNPCEVLAG